MALQNRVTPFGKIVATPQRSMFTDNRDIIPDPATKTLLNRRRATKTWLICCCEFKGGRRAVMASRSWTESFFLYEAVAPAGAIAPAFSADAKRPNGFEIPGQPPEANRVPPPERSRRSRITSGSSEAVGASIRSLATGCTSRWGDGRGRGFGVYATFRKGYRWTKEGYVSQERLHYADGLLTALYADRTQFRLSTGAPAH